MLLRDAKHIGKLLTPDILTQDVLATMVSGRYALYALNVDFGFPHLCLAFQLSSRRR